MPALVVFALNLDTGPFNDLSPRTYIALMGLGFIVGTAGHIVRSKAMVAAGITMIFLATVLLPLSPHASQCRPRQAAGRSCARRSSSSPTMPAVGSNGSAIGRPLP